MNSFETQNEIFKLNPLKRKRGPSCSTETSNLATSSTTTATSGKTSNSKAHEIVHEKDKLEEKGVPSGKNQRYEILKKKFEKQETQMKLREEKLEAKTTVTSFINDHQRES